MLFVSRLTVADALDTGCLVFLIGLASVPVQHVRRSKSARQRSVSSWFRPTFWIQSLFPEHKTQTIAFVIPVPLRHTRTWSTPACIAVHFLRAATMRCGPVDGNAPIVIGSCHQTLKTRQRSVFGVQGTRPDGISSAARAPDAAVRAGLVADLLHGLPQKPTENVTAPNVMMFDERGAASAFRGREWYERKTAALYPSISVTLKHVSLDDMVNEARTDLEQGTNFYHAYLISLLNAHGGLSLLAHHLMDMSSFTVGNVNKISWPSIGRFFRSQSSLYEGRVLSLPLAGDFSFLHYRQDIFKKCELEVPRTLEEYVLVSQALNGTDFDGDGEMDYGSCFPHAGDYSGEFFVTWIRPSSTVGRRRAPVSTRTLWHLSWRTLRSRRPSDSGKRWLALQR